MNKLNEVRKALFNVFGSYISDNSDRAKQIIKDATFTGASDPGQWSPKATVIVNTETGIPSPAYEWSVAEAWIKVDEQLKANGVKLFHEPINGAVVGFYEV